MRGWYRPSDGRWVDIGSRRGYDHAASLSDHDDLFVGILREVDGRLVMLPATVPAEADDETIGPFDVGENVVERELDPNDVAVGMGWVRVNCASSVTTGPYLHAGTEEDLKAGLAFVRSKGMDLARAVREGFAAPFSGNVIGIDLNDGKQRHVEYGLDPRGRLTVVREVEYGGTFPIP